MPKNNLKSLLKIRLKSDFLRFSQALNLCQIKFKKHKNTADLYHSLNFLSPSGKLYICVNI